MGACPRHPWRRQSRQGLPGQRTLTFAAINSSIRPPPARPRSSLKPRKPLVVGTLVDVLEQRRGEVELAGVGQRREESRALVGVAGHLTRTPAGGAGGE